MPITGKGGGRCDGKPDRASKKQQRAYYSGKKKQHTLKVQMVINQANGQIICKAFGKGKKHDFRLFKQPSIPLTPEQLWLADKGYQELAKLHGNSYLPPKKPRKKQLDEHER
jgi:hypothetical protein